MSTRRSQRIGIWIIAIALTLGTFGGFAVMILSYNNNKIDKARGDVLIKEYQDQVAAQSAELSKKYAPIIKKYVSEVGPFNTEDVKSLTTKDLLVGEGVELKANTAYSAYYIGWNPKGEIFDQSIKDDGTLKDPLDAATGLIEGWEKGVIGMKLGGIRELTIPSKQAYGAAGSGELIPPNTPLKFIVLAIPKPNKIPYSAELLQYLQENQ